MGDKLTTVLISIIVIVTSAIVLIGTPVLIWLFLNW